MSHGGKLSAIVVCLLCLTSISTFGQVSASLSGRITDPTGAAVPSATVTAKNVETGVSRAALTSQSGQYQLLELPIGRYEVHATKDGFAEEVRTGISLAVGQDASADLTLQVGQVKQEIEVTENVPMVTASTQEISGLVTEQQVRDLPLNGRSFDLLLTLNPGIVNFSSQKTGGIGVSNSTTGNNFAVSGNRPQQNLFLLNGIEFTGAAENNMQPGGASQQLLGVEAVRNSTCLGIRMARSMQAAGRPGSDRYSVGLEPVARLCLRVSAQQCALTLPITSTRDRRRLSNGISLEPRWAGL